MDIQIGWDGTSTPAEVKKIARKPDGSAVIEVDFLYKNTDRLELHLKPHEIARIAYVSMTGRDPGVTIESLRSELTELRGKSEELDAASPAVAGLLP